MKLKRREFDPSHLDVAAFAAEGAHLEGAWPLATLHRLAEATHPDARPTPVDQVAWKVNGELRPARAAPPEVRLHLHAHTSLALVCQRCLEPVSTPVDVQRDFLFVSDENTAAELDAESEDDVLAITRALKLRELVEDELLLSLPLVPRHEVCPEPLPQFEDEEAAVDHPFAALAALKGKNAPN